MRHISLILLVMFFLATFAFVWTLPRPKEMAEQEMTEVIINGKVFEIVGKY